MGNPIITQVRKFLHIHQSEFVRDLGRLVAIQSVSTDGRHQKEITQSARLTCQLMRRAGLGDVKMLQIGKSNPYAFGQWLGAPGKPTVFLYAHHDVQPVTAAGWKSPPFKLTARAGRLFGRGACDDKGAIVAELAAIAALLKTTGSLPVNVKMVVEGEEEIGSPNLEAFFTKFRKLIHSDVVVVCDTGNLAAGIPSLTYSLRGHVSALLEVASAQHAVHSGICGGFMPDPALALCVILARLFPGEGKNPLPEQLGALLAVTPEERAAIAGLPGEAQTWRKDFGLLDDVRFANDPELHPYEQIWRQPAVTVQALQASSIQGRSNQILPAAAAAIGYRTVPNQDGQQVIEQLRELLTANPPWNVRVKFTPTGQTAWWTTDPHGPAFAAARRALQAGYGKEPTSIGCGGTIGFIRPLCELFGGAPALLLGIEDPRSNAHAANESLHHGDLIKLMASIAFLFHELTRTTTKP